MQTEQRHHSHHHDCCGGRSREPEMFYGYCHETGRMRMMNYGDYMNSMQAAVSNMYSAPMAAMQPLIESMTSMLGGSSATRQRKHDHGRHHDDCGCHEHHDHDCGCHDDCECDCCVRCADVVEYAKCGEVRQIPITFENDTRRQRNVTLQLGTFATSGGQQMAWQTSLSESTFALAPCSHKTILVTVNVDCRKIVTQPTGTTTTTPPGAVNQPPSSTVNAPPQTPDVDSCKVAYATLQGDGCLLRPLVIAVAVLPIHCHAHHAGCGCSCC